MGSTFLPKYRISKIRLRIWETAPFRKVQAQSLSQYRAGLKPAPTVWWSIDLRGRSAGEVNVGAGFKPFFEQG